MKHRLPMQKNLTIDMILPVCHLDELYDNNPVSYRKYTRLKAIDKLCPYRIFDLQTEKPYCRFFLMNRKELIYKGKHYSSNYEAIE